MRKPLPCVDGETETRYVAIYGRVSTEHDAQLAAFDNQIAWYEGIAGSHPEWVIVDRYYDEGITGTAAQKRPEFMRMLADAKKHKFDLVVTREVCRFARNTVDTLTVTRDLSKLGIEVYFIADNIRTMDGDGELRLTIMATLAQEESRKISERVKAGQQISREKGVLYGTGNILGYDRVNGTYVINPEQAFVVRKIFDLYASGLGYGKICTDLTRLGCKNAHGEIRWTVDRIGRILRNATYKGYIGYNKSHSDGFLTQKRVNHTDADFVYIKGDFPPIVPEELWDRCREIRQRRSCSILGDDGAIKRFGKRESSTIWTSKLRCVCGSSFRRFPWHKNADGTQTFGLECHRQKRQVSKTFLIENNMDLTDICRIKSIPSWHLDLMAHKVFDNVWASRKEAVLLACQMIEDCAIAEKKSTSTVEQSLKEKIAKIDAQLSGLRSMCALGDITREEFLTDKARLQQESDSLKLQLEDLNASPLGPPHCAVDMAKIRETLNQWIDLSAPVLPDALIDKFILYVQMTDQDTFNVVLDLSSDLSEDERNMSLSEIARLEYHHNLHPSPSNTLSKHFTDPQELFRFTIDASSAKDYCHLINMRFFGKKWHDMEIIVSI